ncbi:CheR family methyltransferase [Paenibacillus turpanensis]|uniref:CheR family methyltransferase n=1 Tax=Paenibacillus turpanensis TaxID=2689078 RepID=UPI00140AB6A9|nr:protein-glutamate O-methyltransferase CheR [Paenibacillus turpanensis]
MEDKDFLLFIQKVNQHLNIDLAQYKEAQMKRRLTTLRQRRGHDTFASFFDAMIKDKEVLHEFLDRMTINVSEFWRNPNRWEIVEKKIVPELLRTGRKVKLWSAACSTGEEPYTIAMIAAEQKGFPQVQITATDLDTGALEKAKRGVYIDRSLKDVPPLYVNKYFSKQGELFAVSDELKKNIKFEKGNLLTDAFDTNIDLIVCRNVMIYFTEEAKHKLYFKFSRALRTGGILFVGSTEQIFSPGQYGLEPMDTFFYRKVADV